MLRLSRSHSPMEQQFLLILPYHENRVNKIKPINYKIPSSKIKIIPYGFDETLFKKENLKNYIPINNKLGKD